MKKTIHLLTYSLSISTIIACLLQFSVKASEFRETSSCAEFDIPATVQNASCGYITVPEFHDRTTAQTFKLAFVLLKTTSDRPDSTPLIMQQGGPGASSFQRIRHFTPEGMLLPLQKQRDILFIEQRGAYYSQPYLPCDRDEFPTICKERWESESINLDAFNMVQHAHDIALATQILGYDRFNYYGTSYASQLALYILRQYPQRLRTIILDATIATDSDIGAYQLESFSYALRNIFRACDRDRLCRKNYVNLEQKFTNLLNQLEKKPQFLTINIEEETEQYYLNDTTFAFFVRDFLYDAHQYAPQLPRLINDLNAEDFTLFKNIYHQRRHRLAGFSIADGMRFATICAAPNPPIPTLALSSALSFLKEIISISTTLSNFCQLYPVTPLPESVYEPVRSDIPTLILHGEYDPITPLPYGNYVARFLRNAYVFEYPGLGHGVLEQGTCPVIMALEFLDRPQKAPDRSCIAKMGQWGIWENVLLPNAELNQRDSQNVRESRSRYNLQ